MEQAKGCFEGGFIGSSAGDLADRGRGARAVRVATAPPRPAWRSSEPRAHSHYLYRLDGLTRTGIADTLSTLDDPRGHGVESVSVADGFEPALRLDRLAIEGISCIIETDG